MLGASVSLSLPPPQRNSTINLPFPFRRMCCSSVRRVHELAAAILRRCRHKILSHARMRYGVFAANTNSLPVEDKKKMKFTAETRTQNMKNMTWWTKAVPERYAVLCLRCSESERATYSLHSHVPIFLHRFFFFFFARRVHRCLFYISASHAFYKANANEE